MSESTAIVTLTKTKHVKYLAQITNFEAPFSWKLIRNIAGMEWAVSAAKGETESYVEAVMQAQEAAVIDAEQLRRTWAVRSEIVLEVDIEVGNVVKIFPDSP